MEPTLLGFDMIGSWEGKINLMNYEQKNNVLLLSLTSKKCFPLSSLKASPLGQSLAGSFSMYGKYTEN